MDPELWRRGSAALDALHETGAERDAQLARLRRDEPEVAAEVEALLPEQDTEAGLGPAGALEAAWRATESARGHPYRIGPYLVLERIGEGGMGVVYRVRDAKIERSL